MRGEEVVDIAGVGIAETFEVPALGLDRGLHDREASVVLTRLEHQLGGDELQALVVRELQQLGVGDGLPGIGMGGGLTGLHEALLTRGGWNNCGFRCTASGSVA